MQLEIRLAEKEEQLLEKDLIFEQVTRLTERINNRVNQQGKDDTLELAKKVGAWVIDHLSFLVQSFMSYGRCTWAPCHRKLL